MKKGVLHRVIISTYPIELSLNDDGKQVAWFRSCDNEELNNYRSINGNEILISSLLLTDFKYLCTNHLPIYEEENGLWYKMTEDCDCKSKKYLWCKDDIDHRVGKDVMYRASRALSILEKHGLWVKNDINDMPLVTSFDDFMKYNAKRIYLLGNTLSKIITNCKLLPYHIFGICKENKSTFNFNFMFSGEKSLVYFKEKAKVFYCRGCHKFGHTLQFCSRRDNICFKCQRHGHFYKNCTFNKLFLIYIWLSCCG